MTRAQGLAIHDSTDDRRMHLLLVNGNFPQLGMSQRGQQGPPSLEMTAGQGSRSLKMHDRRGYPLFSVSAADKGSTALSMRHPNHERSLQIESGPNDTDGPAIAFLGPARKDGTGGLLPHLQLGFDPDHEPYVRVIDAK
jgi:hypothetical protein